MADRKQITADLRKKYGDSMTTKEVLEYLGNVSYRAAKPFLASLDSFTLVDGGHKRFLTIDVAAAIDRRQDKDPRDHI